MVVCLYDIGNPFGKRNISEEVLQSETKKIQFLPTVI